jgi:hypothetical protein
VFEWFVNQRFVADPQIEPPGVVAQAGHHAVRHEPDLLNRRRRSGLVDARSVEHHSLNSR